MNKLLKGSSSSLRQIQASAGKWRPSVMPAAHHAGSRAFVKHQLPRTSSISTEFPAACGVHKAGGRQKHQAGRLCPYQHVSHAERLLSIRGHATSSGHDMKDNWEVKMLYDGDCPLCMREVNMLRKRDKDQNKIGFVDISSQEYSPTDNAGITYEQAMGTIHGILPGDKVITNVDVFRKLYEVVGLGWVYSITKVGFINRLANRVYALWAKYRLPITGRPDIETVLRQKKDTCKGSTTSL